MSSHCPSLPFLDALPRSAGLHHPATGRLLDHTGLQTAVIDTAAELQSIGLGHGSKVVLCLDDPMELITTLFACWAVGATAVLVPPTLTPPERENVAKRLDAHHWCGGPVPTLPPIPQNASHGPLQLDDTAVILLTSGSTGVPKGVELTLRGLMARVALNCCWIGPQTLAETLCILPLHFGHGLIGNLLTPLWAGGRVHLWPGPALADWGGIADYLSTGRITFLSSVPVHWRMLSRFPRPKELALARVHVGSAPLSVPQWRAIADWAGTPEVWNMFGMTECANWFSGAKLSYNARDGEIGIPWGGAAAVMEQDGAVSRTGRGELLIQSPSMMARYFGDPDKTRDALSGNWFRTGDVADIGADGAIRLCGRIKSEINRAGQKIHPEEIDLLLERHPDISEACAFAIPDPLAGETVGAAIVTRCNAVVDAESVLQWLQSRIRPEAMPTRIWILNQIPRTDRGKIVRDAVRDAAMGEPA